MYLYRWFLHKLYETKLNVKIIVNRYKRSIVIVFFSFCWLSFSSFAKGKEDESNVDPSKRLLKLEKNEYSSYCNYFMNNGSTRDLMPSTKWHYHIPLIPLKYDL